MRVAALITVPLLLAAAGAGYADGPDSMATQSVASVVAPPSGVASGGASSLAPAHDGFHRVGRAADRR